MKTIENGVSTEATMTTNAAVAEPALEPADNYAEIAQTRIVELAGWRKLLPNLLIPQTPDATRRLNSTASVPPEFVELTNVAVANQTALMRPDGASPVQVRGLMSYADSFGPLADELEAIAHFIRHSVAAARGAAGTEALTTYSLAKRLAKDPRYAHLRPYVADMRRALGRTRKLTPEAAAQRAAERAARLAEKAAKKAARLLPPAASATTVK